MKTTITAIAVTFVVASWIGYSMAYHKYKPLKQAGRQHRILKHLREHGPSYSLTLADDLNMAPKVLNHELVLLSQTGRVTSTQVDVTGYYQTHRRLFQAVHVDEKKRGGRHRKPEVPRKVIFHDPEIVMDREMTARGVGLAKSMARKSS